MTTYFNSHIIYHMSWEETFIKQAAIEELLKESLLKTDEKEPKAPEGITYEPRNRKALERLAQQRDNNSQGQPNKS